MKSANSPELVTIKRIVTIYNLLINLCWTVLAFAPIGYFCYVTVSPGWLYGFLPVSISVFFLPASFFRNSQLGNTTTMYHKLGIRTVRKYTQDGMLVNRLIRRTYTTYNPVRDFPIKTYLSKAAANERFHSGVFVFFLLTTIYALAGGHWAWALVFTVSNLIYNVYPILLQQYNRIRFQQLVDRRQMTSKTSQ